MRKVMKRTMVLAAIAMMILFAHSVGMTRVLGSLPFDAGAEYTSGHSSSAWGGVWYAWVNVSGTQVIFTALYSEAYNSPVRVFLGEHYNSAVGQPVLVGNALTMIEVYNDTNHNGILDANYTAGTSELEYYTLVNSSRTFDVSPVQKTDVNGSVHYTWGVTYGGIDAFLVSPDPYSPGYGGWSNVTPMDLSEVGLSYDYSIEQNMSFLKTSFNVGNFTILQNTDPAVSLEGLSMSLLYTTQAVSPAQYTIVADDKAFNSTLNTPLTAISKAQINLGNLTTFEFRFRDNYTLYTSTPTEHAAKYSACPTDSIDPQLLRENWNTPFWFAQDNMMEMFPDVGYVGAPFDVNFTTSSFNYRIQYPEWSGNRIEHDPTYVAFMSTQPSVPEFPIETLILVPTITAVLLAMSTWFAKHKNRKLAPSP
jgi:hypothetical protein